MYLVSGDPDYENNYNESNKSLLSIVEIVKENISNENTDSAVINTIRKRGEDIFDMLDTELDVSTVTHREYTNYNRLGQISGYRDVTVNTQAPAQVIINIVSQMTYDDLGRLLSSKTITETKAIDFGFANPSELEEAIEGLLDIAQKIIQRRRTGIIESTLTEEELLQKFRQELENVFINGASNIAEKTARRWLLNDILGKDLFERADVNNDLRVDLKDAIFIFESLNSENYTGRMLDKVALAKGEIGDVNYDGETNRAVETGREGSDLKPQEGEDNIFANNSSEEDILSQTDIWNDDVSLRRMAGLLLLIFKEQIDSDPYYVDRETSVTQTRINSLFSDINLELDIKTVTYRLSTGYGDLSLVTSYSDVITSDITPALIVRMDKDDIKYNINAQEYTYNITNTQVQNRLQYLQYQKMVLDLQSHLMHHYLLQ